MSGPERALIRFAGTAAVVCLAACRREAERPVPPAVPSAAAQAVAQAASSAVVSAAASAAASEAAAQAAELAARPAPGAAWPALVRDEQWDEAWRVLRALPAEEAARPEVRYVSARVALARGDAAAALPLLQDIEGTLPLLADDVLRRRAEAKLAVGPFEEAGDWYSARQTAAAQLDAAKAFERAKDPRRARAAVERVFAADKRTRAQEAEARSMRIRLAESIGDTERADARWLAIEGADAPAAADALALLAKVDPKHPLHTDELFARAQVLSDAGHTDEALHALDAIAAAPGAAVPPLKRLRARGNTLFKAHGRGSEAAKVLSECAVQGGPDAAEDAFHAARALSRADRDEEAIRGYQDVIKRWPKSSWGVHAAYFIPYLKMLHAEWTECARAFDTFVRKRPEAEEVRDAQRFGALCELMAGGARAARRDFEHLVEDEPDAIPSARAADLAALAALHDGDRTHAVARWTDVARTHPLSWPALVARARLLEAGAALPPAIDGGETPDASALAPLTVTLPAPAGLLHDLGLDADAEEALHEREGTVTRGAGARAPEALCAAYGEIGRARRRYQIARTLPSSLVAYAPTPATRWAWDCTFPQPYAEVVQSAEAAEKLPPGLLWAVMRQESAFDPDAVSPAHAVGLMQLLPETARGIAAELGLSHEDARLTSPPYAIRVGARALRKLLDEFHGNVALAVVAYNAGADAVERWLSRAPGMQTDTFVERIPYRETRDYVVRVMGNLARYAYLAGGEDAVPRVELVLEGKGS